MYEWMAPGQFSALLLVSSRQADAGHAGHAGRQPVRQSGLLVTKWSRCNVYPYGTRTHISTFYFSIFFSVYFFVFVSILLSSIFCVSSSVRPLSRHHIISHARFTPRRRHSGNTQINGIKNKKKFLSRPQIRPARELKCEIPNGGLAGWSAVSLDI